MTSNVLPEFFSNRKCNGSGTAPGNLFTAATYLSTVAAYKGAAAPFIGTARLIWALQGLFWALQGWAYMGNYETSWQRF